MANEGEGNKELDQKSKEQLKWFYRIALPIIFLLFVYATYRAGTNIGDDIGEFIYNLTH